MKDEQAPEPVKGKETEHNTTGQGMITNQMMPMGMMPGMYGGMTPGMMPGMAPGMAPGMMPGMMGYQNFLYCEDPMKELLQSTGAIIRQDIEMFEVISGCETQNRYQVFLQSTMGLKIAFKCIESSGCCSRSCCPNDCRGLHLTINHVASAAEIVTDISKKFLIAEKPCCGGCCCFCRPHMDIIFNENKKLIGRVREPFTCCDRDAEVLDEVGNLKYRIVGSCCQMGFCCGSSAEKLIEIEFKILKNGEQVGFMKKMNSSFGEYFSKADSYIIAFPVDATPEEKILLICAGLLIDYQNFEREETPKKNRQKQGL